jgi:ribosomal protein L21E
MAKFNEGDRVKIIARDQTNADIKSGLYYPHFANLRGAILKVYGEEASVLVDRETLPDEVRKRHEATETAERKRYLDRLSEDARGKLGQKEKEFNLAYAVLVSVNDLEKDKTPPAKSVSAAEAEAEAKRLTEKDLEAREAAFLAERAKSAS